MLGALMCGCGQCLPCRINRRRLWSTRMLLESATTVSSVFATLTYSAPMLPYMSTLLPLDLTKFLKRLRKEAYPEKIRYFAVGEYGTRSARPHYHLAIFGLDSQRAGGDDGRGGLVKKAWPFGHIYVGDLTSQSASYICGYVTKKMTNKKNPYVASLLKGREPEFARMSLKPGIGALAMKDVASCLESYTDIIYDQFKTGTFPSVLNVGGKLKPLGRYLRSILRQELGYGRSTTDDEKKAFSLKMRVLFEVEKDNAKAQKRAIRNYYADQIELAKQFEKKYKVTSYREGTI